MSIEQIVSKLWEIKGPDGTISEMAEKTGLYPSTLWRIMHGERAPSGEVLVKLMDTYPALVALFLPADMTSGTLDMTNVTKEATNGRSQ